MCATPGPRILGVIAEFGLPHGEIEGTQINYPTNGF